jgi:hypothetical protein
MVAHHGRLYTPHGEGHEATATVTLTSDDEHFYRTQAGIRVPVFSKETDIGPESHLELGEGGEAPPTVLRLPNGSLAWLAPLLWTAMTIWVVYFYVMYQMFRIPIVGEIRDTDTRRVPLVGFAIVVALGLLLVLMLITSPLSHPHLLP